MQTQHVHAAIVNLAERAAYASLFRAGETLRAVVEGNRPNLALLVGGTRIPLSDPGSLAPGQTVFVEVTETAQGLQLRLLPQGRQAAAGQPPAEPLANLVAAVLESLGAIRVAQSPEQLLPAQLPHTEAAVRSLLSLFALRGTFGQDLQQIADLMAQAAGAGALSQDASGQAVAVLAQLLAAAPGGLKDLIERLVGQSGRTAEGRIAHALATGDLQGLEEALRGDLQAVLSSLRNDEVLGAFLRRAGQLRVFQGAVGRVMERVSGGHLQNLRALDQPYVFIEIPFGPGSAIVRGQIHFFGEGAAKRRRIDPKNATVAFDLSTTRLGDLWITLRAAKGYCNCRLCATFPAAVEAIEKASEDLSDALRKAGYERATVSAALWDGDRLREVALLMRRFSGIDVNA